MPRARRHHGVWTGRIIAGPPPGAARAQRGRHRPWIPAPSAGWATTSAAARSPDSVSTASTLIAAGIEEADAFAAVSSGDNSNIIAARVARETFGVQKVIARIYDPKRAEVYERLGIPTVATVPWTASRLLKSVLGESTAEAWRDPSGAVVMLQVSPHEGWVGHKLSEFEAATGSRVGLITRFGVGELPTVSTLIQAGDTIARADDRCAHTVAS